MRTEPGLKKIEVFPKSVIYKVMMQHIPIFKKRVQRGVDGKGRKFKSYTKSYSEYKGSGFISKREKGGRIESMKGKKLLSSRISPPDLTVTGEMLGGMSKKGYGKDYWKMGWTGEQSEKVDYNRRMGRDITNDIPNTEKKQICDLLAKEMDRQFKIKLKDVTITVGK